MGVIIITSTVSVHLHLYTNCGVYTWTVHRTAVAYKSLHMQSGRQHDISKTLYLLLFRFFPSVFAFYPMLLPAGGLLAVRLLAIWADPKPIHDAVWPPATVY